MTMDGPLRQPDYLSTVQYAAAGNLGNRSNLHDRFSTSPMSFRAWESGLINWPEVGDVLEVGSGPGRFWALDSLPRSMRVTATDLSAGMVADASAALAINGYADTCTAVCDAQQLPFDDAMFDVVMANHMLYHLQNPVRGLREFRRVLRPDGVALLATNAPGHMRQLNDAIAEVFDDAPSGLNSVFGIDNGEMMLRELFSSITWYSFVNPLIVSNVEDLLAYATSLPPAQNGTPAQREQLAEVFRREVERGDGAMRIDTRTGAFVCRGAA